ncbi:hypothetical protein V3481_006907 [Fusarium oxysporum f. sp. vasinfectum]
MALRKKTCGRQKEASSQTGRRHKDERIMDISTWRKFRAQRRTLLALQTLPRKRSYSTALYASSGTAHAARHLLRQHQIAEFGDSSPSLTTPFTLAAASASSSVRALSRQASLGFQLGSHFDERSWKARFVDWIILEDVTFRQASSERLRWLIANGGELASQLLPEHHTTVCSWIRLTFESRRQIIFNLVKDAKSSVHLSFDLWTASNGFHYIGIVGHFVDSEGEKT